jgi:hypothetical protein
MKITTKPSNEHRNRKFDWLYISLLVSAICFSLVSCDRTSKPEIKPHAAATTTPLEWSEEYSQSGHYFICPDNTVMMGRRRGGNDPDENSAVWFRCATVQQFEQLKTADSAWSGHHDEDNHIYSCPGNKVLTGTSHYLDEKEPTDYHCSLLIDAWGNQIQPLGQEWESRGDESSHTFECADNQVLVGRSHRGDEHDATKYQCATLW